MERAEIFEKVVALAAETLGVDESSITEDTTFDDLGADSFDKLALVTAFEDEFDTTLDDEVLESIASVKDAVDAIEQAQN